MQIIQIILYAFRWLEKAKKGTKKALISEQFVTYGAAKKT